MKSICLKRCWTLLFFIKLYVTGFTSAYGIQLKILCMWLVIENILFTVKHVVIMDVELCDYISTFKLLLSMLCLLGSGFCEGNFRTVDSLLVPLHCQEPQFLTVTSVHWTSVFRFRCRVTIKNLQNFDLVVFITLCYILPPSQERDNICIKMNWYGLA